LGALPTPLTQFEDVLRDFVTIADPDTSKKMTRILQQVREVEPSVTVIGQIKAGKTSLINAMIGAPELLPTDVNPWTSVVTSLHINTPLARAERPGEVQVLRWRRMGQAGVKRRPDRPACGPRRSG
jgi:hypothetical protein